MNLNYILRYLKKLIASLKTNKLLSLASLLIVALGLIVGQLIAANDPVAKNIAFEPSPSTDVEYYVVYVWQGDDPASWNVANMDSVGYVVEDGSATYRFPFAFDGNNIIVGGEAVDESGNRSEVAISKWYTYEEISAPQAPLGIRLE